MHPLPRRGPGRALRRPPRRAWLVSLALLPAPLAAGQLSFKPVFTLEAAYDTNVFFTADDPQNDYFGSVGLDFPLEYRGSSRSSISLRYFAAGERYRELTQLDDFPIRQNASLAYSYAPQRGWSLGLNGGYSESQRPEDVFPATGLDLGRRKSQSASGGASLGRTLGQYGKLDLGYSYSRALYLENETTDYQSGYASLGRSFGGRTRLDARYLYDRYGFEDGTSDASHAATLGLTHSFSPRTSLSLRGGMRFAAGETNPEAEAALTHTWPRGSISLSYSHTRAFAPVRGGATSLSEVDRGGLSLSFQGRRHRVSLSPGYYRNRAETFESETWRGSFDAVYMVKWWLGLGAGYAYTFQRRLDEPRDETERHVGRVGLVIAPWNVKDVQGLR